MSRVWTAVAMSAREYRRTPVLLALLVFLPAYTIWVFTVIAPSTDLVLNLDGSIVQTTLSAALPVFMTPMSAALVAAIAGLFLMTSAANDRRLVITGYRPVEVVLARLGLLVGVSGLATVVSVAVLWTAYTPESPIALVGAVWVGALIYGMAGVLVGTTLDRLPGVYLLLFGAVVDLFLFQNPLATDSPAVATVLPGHFPLALATDAAFTGTIEWVTVAGSLAALAVLTALATAAFYRVVR